MLAAVFRPSGSGRRFSFGRRGNSPATAETVSAPVTTNVREGGISPRRRFRVARMREIPPNSFRKGFGVCPRLIGHSRAPGPPARITA